MIFERYMFADKITGSKERRQTKERGCAIGHALLFLLLLVSGGLAGCNKTVRHESAFIEPGAGDVSVIVKNELSRQKSKDNLLVYVSASWCEPCKVFQQAVHDGRLQHEMPDVRFLKFDADVDEKRLNDAGYGGRMIPRFVKPGVDGKGSDHRFEGSIKGPKAFGNMLPRLKKLISY